MNPANLEPGPYHRWRNSGWRLLLAPLGLILAVGALTGCEIPGQVPSVPVVVTTAPTATAPAPQAASIAATPSPPPLVTAEAGPALAARVNGQPIFMADYEKQVAQFEVAMANQGVDLKSEGGKQQLAQVRRQILEAMIDQVLIEQAAAKAGVTISDEELETKAQESIQQGQGQEQFQKWLADNNLTYEEFKRTLRSQLLAARMFDQVTTAVPTSAEQVHARHILFDTEANAQAVLAELQAGGNFAALAQKYSRDESTRANGGDLGWFPRGLELMPPEVEAEAFRLQPGQISGVIHSQFGYHIVKVEAREAARPLSPEMLQATKQKAFAQWLAEQRAAAVIERFVQD
jgi:parvulin-like peptidyl-prolyl isomerase